MSKEMREQIDRLKNWKQFLNENMSKSISNITEEDLFDCLKNDIPDGWEVFNYHIDKHWQGIKIRKKYDEDEIDFNEDGYKYKTIFLSIGKTSHYKCLIEKGYNV
jgi:hypothetical protein